MIKYLFYLFLFCLYIRNKNKVEGICICNNGSPAPSASPQCTPSPSPHICVGCDGEYELSMDDKCYIPKIKKDCELKGCNYVMDLLICGQYDFLAEKLGPTGMIIFNIIILILFVIILSLLLFKMSPM
jgi:hypothetical protein